MRFLPALTDMKRTILAVLVALSIAASFEAEAQRVRAVRHPAPQCSFGLVVGMSTPVAAAGVASGAIEVTAVPSTCTSWEAYSEASWVALTRVNANSVRVDVAPNPTNTPRTTTLLIAGIRYTLSQEGSPVISPPIEDNELENPGFDADLSFWGWQDRFPNGPGNAAWSSNDANGNPNSGSIRLRNTRAAGATGHAFQQLQCVAIEGGVVYEWGGKFLANATGGTGEAVFGIVEYEDEGCNVAAVDSENKTPGASTPGMWQSEEYTKRMRPDTRSAFVVVGSIARVAGTFEVFIDDVFLRKR